MEMISQLFVGCNRKKQKNKQELFHTKSNFIIFIVLFGKENGNNINIVIQKHKKYVRGIKLQIIINQPKITSKK